MAARQSPARASQAGRPVKQCEQYGRCSVSLGVVSAGRCGKRRALGLSTFFSPGNPSDGGRARSPTAPGSSGAALMLGPALLVGGGSSMSRAHSAPARHRAGGGDRRGRRGPRHPRLSPSVTGRATPRTARHRRRGVVSPTARPRVRRPASRASGRPGPSAAGRRTAPGTGGTAGRRTAGTGPPRTAPVCRTRRSARAA